LVRPDYRRVVFIYDRSDREGPRQRAFHLLKVIQPYKGGNDALLSLVALDSRDKHEMLTLVCCVFRSLSFTTPTPTATLQYTFTPDNSFYIVEDGTELFRAKTPFAKMEVQPQLTLATARHDRLLMDSALRDTAQKDRKVREFLGLARRTQLLEEQETLARLGYGIELTGEFDSPTRVAIRTFEHRHGLPETGGPDAPELQVAIRYVDRKTLNLFALPALRVDTLSWSNGASATVHAKGTWAPGDPPRQTSEIWCFRSQRTCHESMAYLVFGELYVGTTDYDVERWDEDELVARGNAICVSEVLTINRASESVVLVRGSRNAGNKACQMLRVKYDDIVLRLVDGPAVAESLDAEALKYVRLGPSAAAMWKRLRGMKKQP
jgi:hypothetical protein